MAKRYTFRFETLLRLRQQFEDEQKRAVAARLREIHALEERQRMFLQQIANQASQTRQALMSGSVDVDDLRLGRHWTVRLRRGVLETEATINAQKAQLVLERQKLAEAAKNKKVLERLKEHRLSQYMAEQDRLEQKELDEISVMTYSRRQLGEEAEPT